MSLQIGDTAPDFSATTTSGEIDFHKWIGNGWAILFSHPADFTPICTTELGRTAQLKAEFDKRNTKVIFVSVNDLSSHEGWVKDINATQNTTVNFPVIADPDRKVAELYGMIHPNASTTAPVRSVFFIGPDKKIKATITYPASTGRNYAEILRVLDSLQLTSEYSVGTPVDWEVGQDVVISTAIKDEDIPKNFPKGHRVVNPYLRYTPQPNI
ncbi:peroxiredoxin [Albibacterium bauzanense]|uniref:Alkyl hydroperoxide reductase subunit AhpC n=1 Tax=Albibacterium bauzanense TaxID=653929 RepID=A0A4R1LPV8_9SPHI|nr:peroxiredoxin [Albibacterium bauzanense]TCK80792.1 alkyl hydroperoxide reductase subunit AhpC [Albibacterium bauzanense]